MRPPTNCLIDDPIHEDPLRYIGAFENDMKHAHGTFTYADGHKCAPTVSPSEYSPHEGPLRYAGAFENDKMHGQGTFTLPDGSVYHSGLWRN